MAGVKQETKSVGSFTVQADHPRNSDLLLKNIPNCRLRGTVKAGRTVKVRQKDGSINERTPIDQSRHLGQLPEIPGMCLTIFPNECRVIISDPLRSSPALCKQIEQGLKTDQRPFSGPINGVPEREETIDTHTMKTLCREVRQLIDIDHMKVTEGVAPSREEIDKLNGEYLLNGAISGSSDSPKFEKDVQAFKSGERKGMPLGANG